jgi:hypothetical protein
MECRSVWKLLARIVMRRNEHARPSRASSSSAPPPSEEQPQGMCLDKGYDYDEVRDILREFGFTAHIRTRGEENRALKKEAGWKR